MHRRDHACADRVAVERELDLAVDALEALLLGEAEAGGVLVEPLERPQRRLGLLAAVR